MKELRLEPAFEDAEEIVDAALQEFQHLGVGRRRERPEGSGRSP